MRSLLLSGLMLALAVLGAGSTAANSANLSAGSNACATNNVAWTSLCGINVAGSIVGGYCGHTSCYVRIEGTATAQATVPSGVQVDWTAQMWPNSISPRICSASAFGTSATCSAGGEDVFPVYASPQVGGAGRVHIIVKAITTVGTATAQAGFLVSNPGVGADAIIMRD